MSSNNLASGGNIWNHIEVKKQERKFDLYFKKLILFTLAIGLLIIAISITCASIFGIDNAFQVQTTENGLILNGQVRYFIFYLLGAMGPVFIILGAVMLLAEKFTKHFEWILSNKKRILFALIAVLIIWLTLTSIIIGIGKQLNDYNKADTKQIEAVQNWVKNKTNSVITEKQAKTILEPNYENIIISSSNKKLTFNTERKGSLSIAIKMVKGSPNN